MHNVGLSLKQSAIESSEAKTARQMVNSLAGLETLPWLFTGDAAFAERPLVETILDKQGMYLLDLKDNLSDVKANAEWAFSLPTCEQDTTFEDSEVRSGELWLREIETRPAPPDLTNNFPAAEQFVRCIRSTKFERSVLLSVKQRGRFAFKKPNTLSPVPTQMLLRFTVGGEVTGK